jgi:hypothetical protein
MGTKQTLIYNEIPMKIYLDNCCFNRPYDDQSHLRIRLESEAKLKIQEEIRTGNYKLIWSYILDYENSKNPFMERKQQIAKLREMPVLSVAKRQRDRYAQTIRLSIGDVLCKQ